MKNKIFIGIIFIVLASVSFGQELVRPEFSGKWIPNSSDFHIVSVFYTADGIKSVDCQEWLEISHSDPALKIQTWIRCPGQDKHVSDNNQIFTKFVYYTDGRGEKNRINHAFHRELFKSKTKWSGNSVIVANLIDKNRFSEYSLSDDRKILTWATYEISVSKNKKVKTEISKLTFNLSTN